MKKLLEFRKSKRVLVSGECTPTAYTNKKLYLLRLFICMKEIRHRYDQFAGNLMNRSVGYLQEKSAVLSKEHLMDFKLHAPDEKHICL
ncbi:hypothetical protein NQ317_004594 [Molorchus minor]|uniref:Uncharacterized protein n=1 Tax=Molorchus minor TaxID=1323400 RepID=A0ABQ9JA52_9CUCU|nr:hypothetical protein NQ317_004594 [Molorchus minor]